MSAIIGKNDTQLQYHPRSTGQKMQKSSSSEKIPLRKLDTNGESVIIKINEAVCFLKMQYEETIPQSSNVFVPSDEILKNGLISLINSVNQLFQIYDTPLIKISFYEVSDIFGMSRKASKGKITFSEGPTRMEMSRNLINLCMKIVNESEKISSDFSLEAENYKLMSFQIDNFRNYIKDLTTKIYKLSSLNFEIFDQKIESDNEQSPTFAELNEHQHIAQEIWQSTKNEIDRVLSKLCLIAFESEKNDEAYLHEYEQIDQESDTRAFTSEKERDEFIKRENLRLDLRYDLKHLFSFESQFLEFFKSSSNGMTHIEQMKKIKEKLEAVERQTKYEEFKNLKKRKNEFLRQVRNEYNRLCCIYNQMDKNLINAELKNEKETITEQFNIHIGTNQEEQDNNIEITIDSERHIEQLTSALKHSAKNLIDFKKNFDRDLDQYFSENFIDLALQSYNLFDSYRKLLLEIVSSLKDPSSIQAKKHHAVKNEISKVIEKACSELKIKKNIKVKIIFSILNEISNQLQKFTDEKIEKLIVNTICLRIKEFNREKKIIKLYDEQIKEHQERLEGATSAEILAEWKRGLLGGYLFFLNEDGAVIIHPPKAYPIETPEEKFAAEINNYIENEVEAMVSRITYKDPKGTFLFNVRYILTVILNTKPENQQTLPEKLFKIVEKIEKGEKLEESKEFILNTHKRIFDTFGPIATQLLKKNYEVLNDPQLKPLLELLEQALTRTNPEVMQNLKMIDALLDLMKFYRALLVPFLLDTLAHLVLAYTLLFPDDKVGIKNFKDWSEGLQNEINITLGKNNTRFQWKKSRKFALGLQDEALGYLTQDLQQVIPPPGSKENHGEVSLSLIYKKISEISKDKEAIAQECLRKLTLVMIGSEFPSSALFQEFRPKIGFFGKLFKYLNKRSKSKT